MQSKKIQSIFYQITPQDQTVLFRLIDGSKMYDNRVSGSFVRKAIYKEPPLIINPRFADTEFILSSQTNLYKVVRLYQLYNQQVPLFPQDEQFSSYIEPQQLYNSFMAESGLISYDYLRTLFITQKINKQGYYQYFIKRDGEYYLEYCDDIIPVDRKTRKPLWNLSEKHPWQLLLLKVWLKHCRSFQSLYNAEPFALLQAFGLPEYQAFNFRKQLRFLRNQNSSPQKKKQNEKLFAMNKSDVIILAKTVDNSAIKKVGLLPNFAGYRILRITKPDQISLYRVYSTLPCYWVGSYNPVQETKLNKVYNNQMYLDLQRNILMTQKQLLSYFNKFYVVPFQLSQPQMLLTQDCVNLTVQRNKPSWITFEVKQASGMLAISIQLPKIRDQRNRYPEFRYFLSKHIAPQQIYQSRRFSILSELKQDNMYLQSSCFKWQCYRIDYVQGYHHNSSFFCRADEGVYVLFIEADMDGPINVRFDSFLRITKPQIYFPSHEEVKQIFDSTFYNISQDVGVEATIEGKKSSQSICLNNSFEQLGYGSISIKTLPNAQYKIAMRIYPEKLKEAGYRVVQHYEEFQSNKQIQKNYVLVSARGRPQIIVLQKLENRKQENTIGIAFPPPGTVQFLRVFPYPK